jgi:hypothetical protein
MQLSCFDKHHISNKITMILHCENKPEGAQ